MSLALQISELLGGMGQFVFGLLTIVISVLALVKKRSDIFRTELAKNQLAEMNSVRMSLIEIFFDVHYVSQFKSQLEVMGWSLEDFRRKCPDQWRQFERYQKNSLDVFYKFMLPGYYLFPRWLSAEKVKAHFRVMEEFAPFTIFVTGKKTIEDLEEYQCKIIALIRHIDEGLSQHA